MPKNFGALSDSYASLGAPELYEHLAAVLDRATFARVLAALRDIVYDPAIELSFRDEPNFANLLLADRSPDYISQWRERLGLVAEPPHPAHPDDKTSPPPQPLSASGTPPAAFASPAPRPVEKPLEVPATPIAPKKMIDELWLTIREGERTLKRGEKELIQLAQAPEDFDWAGSHYDDGSASKCNLATARAKLPIEWEESEILAFGESLGALLWGSSPAPDVLEAFRTDHEILRFVLDLDEASAAVPWEYLRIEKTFVLDRRVSIVRHVDTTRMSSGSLVLDKYSPIAFAYSNPPQAGRRSATAASPSPAPVAQPVDDVFGTDEGWFDSDSHQQQIADALRHLRAHVTPLSNCSEQDIYDELVGKKMEVAGFHFLGHGVAASSQKSASLVVLDKDRKTTTALPADNLARYLSASKARFAFFGACYSGAVPPKSVFGGIASGIVALAGIPVVAMQFAVPQSFSTGFAAAFYRALGEAGGDIEEAVHRARMFPHENRRHAFGIPVLYADVHKAAEQRPTLNIEKPPKWHLVGAPIPTASIEEALKKYKNELLPPSLHRAVVAALEKERESSPEANVPLPSNYPPLEQIERLHESLSNHEARKVVEDAVRETRRAQSAKPPATLRAGEIKKAGDDPLRLSWDEICEPIDEAINRRFSFPEELIPTIVAELEAGRHVLLIGPAGTGKTQLAQALVEALGYRCHLATASADWTHFEVVGGFFPRPVRDEESKGPTRMEFIFRRGHALEAIMANWHAESVGAGRYSTWRRRSPDTKWKGTWLLLDELNRADIDRAMGGLFTAMETRKLRVPVEGTEHEQAPTAEIPIPQDFRIIGTVNGTDRHYLFRMSDALKRRFAFVEVPVAKNLGDEWSKLSTAANLTSNPDDVEKEVYLALRRFVYLARVFHPVGSAQFLAALRFLEASQRMKLQPEFRLSQSIIGSILPGLEDVGGAVLNVLLTWSSSNDPTTLADAMQKARHFHRPAEAPSVEVLAHIEALRRSNIFNGNDNAIPVAQRDAAKWLAERLTRPATAPSVNPAARAIEALLDHERLV